MKSAYFVIGPHLTGSSVSTNASQSPFFSFFHFFYFLSVIFASMFVAATISSKLVLLNDKNNL